MILVDMNMPKSCIDCCCTYEDRDGETRCALGSPDIDWDQRPCECPMLDLNNEFAWNKASCTRRKVQND